MIDSRCRRLLACILCSTIIFTIIPNNINKSVNADTVVNYEGDKPSSDCSYRSVEEAYFTAEVKTTNKWSGHSNIEIKFKNTGTETIHDWYFTFDFNYKIENPFNCRVIESKDNLYTIGNNDWNQDIQPGQSVTVGFTASSKDGSEIKDMPTFYLLNTQTVTLKSNDLTYKYEEYSNWSSGFNGALILTNKTKDTIRDWTITFGANRPITQADSSVFTDNGDGTYTITNDGNNQNIAKGQSYRIGIQGGSNDPSKAFTLTDFTATAKKMALKLTDDKDKNGIADVLEVDFNGTVTVTPTDIPTSTPTATPTATNTPTAKPTATSMPTATATSTPKPTVTATGTPTATNKPISTPTATSTPKPTATQKPTVTNSPRPTATNTPTAKPTNTVTPEPTVTATPTASITPDISVTPTNTGTTTPLPTAMPTGVPDEIDYYTDTDGDGLPDDLEDYYGTDKNKKDTDGDGVNDLYEIILETDPLTKDDNGSKDADNDGLSNAKESQLGTNPKNRDSDLDGLTDGAEVNLHGTDPQKYDTDEDGISDAGEISLGSNPNKKDSDIQRRQTLTFYPKADSKLKGITKVEVSGYISGYIEENTKIRDISDDDPYTASIEALVGIPVSIETTGDFDEMAIKFYFEEGDFDVNDLRVLWYDEENFQYVVLDPNDCLIYFGENSFEVTTNHFSKYMLIDQGAWVKTWSRGMLQAGETSALGGSYSLEGYRSKIANWLDSDKDGLPDDLEINGMITNKGTVVRTDPNNPDSDDDGLTDGYEMGEMCLTKYAFELGTFQYFVRYWYAEYGMRPDEWVFFRMRSDPNEKDSDGDGADDGVDKTKNDKNKPVNYILHYDDPAITGLFGPTEEYLAFFIRKKMNVEMFYIQKYEDFDSVMHNLLHERVVGTRSSFTQDIKYSSVDNMIILFHGDPYQPRWDLPDSDPDAGFVHINDVKRLLSETNCHISNVDLLCCYGGRKFAEHGSFAEAFLNSNKVDAVYASPSETHYEFFSQTNYVFEDSFYKYYIYDSGYSKIIITVDLGWHIPLMYRV